MDGIKTLTASVRAEGVVFGAVAGNEGLLCLLFFFVLGYGAFKAFEMVYHPEAYLRSQQQQQERQAAARADTQERNKQILGAAGTVLGWLLKRR